MIQASSATVLNPSEETIRLGPLEIKFLVTGRDSHGSVAVFEFSIPAGEKLRAPAHSHDAYEETIYGLDGVITWTVDGEALAVGPGDSVCIPRGAVHRFDNLGIDAARALVIATPAKIGPGYFHEVAAAMAESAGGPPNPARMAEVMRRHGLTPAAPAS